jgi:hypothetical protein
LFGFLLVAASGESLITLMDMDKYFVLAILLLSMGCSENITIEDLEKLNGYWEIDLVTFPDGKTKEYTVSTSVDYIKLEGLEGFRKKVQPKLNGTFETSNDAEIFLISKEKEGFFINYKTELSEWSERLKKLKSDSFSVINSEKIEYQYKRFEPISITP